MLSRKEGQKIKKDVLETIQSSPEPLSVRQIADKLSLNYRIVYQKVCALLFEKAINYEAENSKFFGFVDKE